MYLVSIPWYVQIWEQFVTLSLTYGMDGWVVVRLCVASERAIKWPVFNGQRKCAQKRCKAEVIISPRGMVSYPDQVMGIAGCLVPPTG